MSSTPSMRDRRLAEAYPRIAADLINPLIELLAVAREICGGDIDKFLILLAVAVRTGEDPEFKKLDHARLLAGEVAVIPSLGTNVHSIAASVGMPRESVRRKLAELYETGWFVRQQRDIRFTAKAYQELAPLREAIERLALRNADVVEAVTDG